MREKLYRYFQVCDPSLFDADDAVDAVLCLAWENLETLRNMQSAESWLFAIARNYLRKQSRHCCLSLPAEEVLPSCCSAEDAAMREETELLLQDLLQRLPLSQRQTIYACCYLGLRPAQAAALLQADPHAVSGRLYRGLKTLRKMWEALR